MGKMLAVRVITAGLMLSFCGMAGARQSQRPADDRWAQMRRLSAEDHKRMMDLLGIKSLRPGRNGMNPQAVNYANYDEAKANPYPNLPDPLVLKNPNWPTFLTFAERYLHVSRAADKAAEPSK
jgi:hypothetical protein